MQIPFDYILSATYNSTVNATPFQFLAMNVMMTLNVLTCRTPTVEIVTVTSWLIPVCARGVTLIMIKLTDVKSQEPNNLVITKTHAAKMMTAKRGSSVATANVAVLQATDIMPNPRIARKVGSIPIF